MSTSAALDQMNFTGGYPIGKDFAPSLIFSLIYVALVPVVIYRWTRPVSRCRSLIYPTLFVVIRIGSFILRTVMSKVNYGKGTFIAELVLLAVPFFLITSTTIDLWERHVASGVSVDAQPLWLQRVCRFQQLGLLAATIMSIVSSAMSGGSDPNIDLINRLRKASYLVSLAVVVTTFGGVLMCHGQLGLRTHGAVVLLSLCTGLFVTTVYSIARVFTTNAGAWVRSRAAYYVLWAAVEVVLIGILLGIAIPVLFPGATEVEDERRSEQYMLKETAEGNAEETA